MNTTTVTQNFWQRFKGAHLGYLLAAVFIDTPKQHAKRVSILRTEILTHLARFHNIPEDSPAYAMLSVGVSHLDGEWIYLELLSEMGLTEAAAEDDGR